jgi:hypothetical protein
LLIFIGRKKVKSGTGASIRKHVPVIVALADAIAKLPEPEWLRRTAALESDDYSPKRQPLYPFV